MISYTSPKTAPWPTYCNSMPGVLCICTRHRLCLGSMPADYGRDARTVHAYSDGPVHPWGDVCPPDYRASPTGSNTDAILVSPSDILAGMDTLGSQASLSWYHRPANLANESEAQYPSLAPSRAYSSARPGPSCTSLAEDIQNPPIETYQHVPVEW